MTQMQPDLSVYSEVDPDDIYNAGGKSLTFFYTGTMYAKPYPTNHDDMLREMPELFYDVFPDLKRVLPEHLIGDFLSYGRSQHNPRLEAFITQAGIDPVEVQRTGGSRGKALKLGDAMLGRVGEYQGDIIMALWSPVDEDWYEDALGNPDFIAPVRKVFGNVNEMIVVGAGEPRFWSEITGEATPDEPMPNQDQDTTDTIVASDDETVKKKYDINGNSYTLSDLGSMRGRVHSAVKTGPEYQQIMSVLCSDDLWKHPELRLYRPASCPRREDQPWTAPTRTSSQKWVDKSREIYTKEKAQGKSPSTGLLYPAWRAHSESRKPRLTFREFLLLDA